MKKYDIGIVGGGASGMMAAVLIKEQNPSLRVAIFERKDVLGKKLSQTGNGACNISNTKTATYLETKAFFEKLGMPLVEEEGGLVYPLCREAKTVVKVFEKRLSNLHVDVNLETEVVACSKDELFKVDCKKKDKSKTYICEKLLIAGGGKSFPAFGTLGDSYTFAKAFGHTVNKVVPALTSIEGILEGKETKTIKGVRNKALVSLAKNGGVIQKEFGEIQFIDSGVSGICIFNISNNVEISEGETFANYKVFIDFLPDMELAFLKDYIVKMSQNHSSLSVYDFTRNLVKDKLARFLAYDVLKYEGKILSALNLGEALGLFEVLKNARLDILGMGGWKKAQCTKGGVFLDEVYEDTLESKLVEDLYFLGEALDYCGPCGGYNLENAWNTARLAAKKAAGNI